MTSYDPYNGWWPSSWWNSAATLTTLIDFAKTTGRHDYDWVVARTFDQNKGVFAAGARSSDAIDGHFISRSIDDSGWWAIAWIDAYDYTGDSRYLAEAVTIANYIQQYWDTGTCGGGVWWNRERTYKNAVTNGQYLWLTAALHQRITGDTLWLQRARTAAAWYRSSGMINSSGLVNDGLTSACANNGGTVWSYNQGLAIGGFTELWKATGDGTLLATARTLADAAISSPALTRDGVLTESCDVGSAPCDDNQKQFKGIFIRNFAGLAKATGSSTYQSYVQKQADTLWAQDRNSLNSSANAGPASAPSSPTGAPRRAPSEHSPPPRADSYDASRSAATAEPSALSAPAGPRPVCRPHADGLAGVGPGLTFALDTDDVPRSVTKELGQRTVPQTACSGTDGMIEA